jgi:hypothetical protein
MLVYRSTVKKKVSVSGFLVPSRDVMSPTKLSLWPGIIKLFPARQSLVSDIPAVDWKTVE